MKYVLMTGIEFNNQGAYLMMRAMAEEIRTRFGAVPVVGFGNGTIEQKMLAGVSSLVPFDPYWKSGRIGSSSFLKQAKSRIPFVFPSQISAVFDGSGFAFSDQWADRNLSRRADFFEFWRSHQRPVYLLPQAFGPFERTAGPSRRVIESARMVFARDPHSREQVESLKFSSDRTQLHESPDFTCLLDVDNLPVDFSLVGGIPVIPNWNIYERASTAAERESYLENLSGIIRKIRLAGGFAYGLSHEGEKDVRILKLLAARVGEDFRIVSGLNGMQLKRVISASKYVIAGRFHAIASALSSGVPVIIHGWSHKYHYIAEDYGVVPLLADPLGSLESNLKCLDYLHANYDALCETVRSASPKLKQHSLEMWDLIEKDFSEHSYSD